MLKVTITDGPKSRSEVTKDILDSRYVVFCVTDTKETIFCKTRQELFDKLEEKNESVVNIVEIYDGSVNEDGSISFLTKQFREDN
jgi:hypothetical protein